MSRHVWRVIAAVAAAGALVSGCGQGPSQVGAAAIVGTDVLPLDQVQRQIQVALGAEKQQVRARMQAMSAGDLNGDQQAVRQVVTEAVRGELLDRAAAEQGIVVSDADVDAVVAARGGAAAVEQSSLGTLEDERRNIRHDLIAKELGRRYIDRISVRFDVTTATDEADLRRKQDLITSGGPAADALFTTGQSEAGRVVDAATNPSLLSIVGGIDAGNLLVLRPQQQGDLWTLVRVTERRTDLPAPPSGQSAAETAGDSLLQAIGVQMLRPLADRLGVRPNPRYGVWDPLAMAVVDESQVAGSIVPIGR